MNVKVKKLMALVLCLALSVSLFGNLTAIKATDIEDTEADEDIYADVVDGYLTYSPFISASGDVERILYYRVTACDISATGEIVVPSEINGYPVECIDNQAFMDCTGITSVILSEGITRIESESFSGCTSLAEITIPTTMKTINRISPFDNCEALKSVYISDLHAWLDISYLSGGGNPCGWGANLYLNGELVEDLVIPEDITFISSYAFFGVSSLKSVTFPDTLTGIGSGAFRFCENLTQVNNMPEKINNIYCDSFDNTPYLASFGTDESGAIYIGNILYKGTTSVSKYTVKEGTVIIASEAFYGNSLNPLVTVNFPDSLETISPRAFYNLDNLKNLNFGSGLKTLSNNAFESCEKVNAVDLSMCEDLEKIGYGAFRNCTSIETLTMNHNIKKIDDIAFYNCTELQSVELHEGLEILGESAFGGCTKLTSLHIPSTLLEYHKSNHSGATLKTVTCAEDNPTYVAIDNVLYTKDMSRLLFSVGDKESYVLPEETRYIDSYAFKGNTALADITLHDNVLEIGEEAFSDTAMYTDMPNGKTKYIGKYVVLAVGESVSGGGQNVVIADGTIGFADGAIKSYSTIITIPESVKFIGGNLARIKELNVPSLEYWLGVKLNTATYMTYGYITVNGKEITNMVIPDGTTQIKDYILGNCDKLDSIFIPQSVISIGKKAFYKLKSNAKIYCIEGSYAQQYAIENNIKYEITNILPNENAQIDYSGKIIRTDLQNINGFDDILSIADGESTFALGSMFVNGKHFWGTGSSITVYESNSQRVTYTLVVDGDVNGDGVCDVLDATQTSIVQNHLGELDAYQTLAADFDGDGAITISDYSRIVNQSLK